MRTRSDATGFSLPSTQNMWVSPRTFVALGRDAVTTLATEEMVALARPIVDRRTRARRPRTQNRTKNKQGRNHNGAHQKLSSSDHAQWSDAAPFLGSGPQRRMFRAGQREKGAFKNVVRQRRARHRWGKNLVMSGLGLYRRRAKKSLSSPRGFGLRDAAVDFRPVVAGRLREKAHAMLDMRPFCRLRRRNRAGECARRRSPPRTSRTARG